MTGGKIASPGRASLSRHVGAHWASMYRCPECNGVVSDRNPTHIHPKCLARIADREKRAAKEPVARP